MSPRLRAVVSRKSLQPDGRCSTTRAGEPDVKMSPWELRRLAIRILCGRSQTKDFNMPQMFDWIFFAIMIPFPVFLLWDLRRNR
jgi:hypothetical protein